MFYVIWDYYSLELKGKQYKQIALVTKKLQN